MGAIGSQSTEYLSKTPPFRERYACGSGESGIRSFPDQYRAARALSRVKDDPSDFDVSISLTFFLLSKYADPQCDNLVEIHAFILRNLPSIITDVNLY